MAKDARSRMIESAAVLLAMRGVQGTAFSDVLERSGAPRGSIYHHFPEGKDQLVDAAIDLTGTRAIHALDAVAGKPPVEITRAFLDLWRDVLVRSSLRAGCAVLAVTVAAESPDLLDHAGRIFREWRGRMAELYVAGGLTAAAAERLATTVVAASEGAVVVSRAERSLEPFELVATQLLSISPATAGGS
ncbi:MAG TPA: TetR/AcrR family transcriptional regulator [Candidatus Limnocylindrales bacterium]|nr:TetR/AcrR family transcriptional regulator [Candidatus Limnocylindrales bacterium]